MGRTPLAWIGVALGFAGALLDFYSGYLLLSQPSGSSEMGMGTMLASSWAPLIWGTGIVFLGIVLAITSLALVFGSLSRRMRDFGALMVVYGLAMLFIGSSMYAGVTSLMGGNLAPAIGMLVVGILMVANGVLMWRPRNPPNSM
jgi:predicted tellurium resistance membrane protein TerC